ncbi:putative cell wall binding protein [Lachnospiraceae bacterium JC7]|nr:putative cell wall binding protein [Lachnospiraceae bacterium JC7]
MKRNAVRFSVGLALMSVIAVLTAMTAFAGRWVMIKEDWYYLGDDGVAVSNQWVGNYYLGENGVMLTNSWTPDGYYVGDDGAWDGQPARTGQITSPLEGIYEYSYTKTVGMQPNIRSGVAPVTVSINQDGSFTAENAYNKVSLKKLKDGTYSGWTDFEYYHLDSSGLFIEFGDGADFYKKST